MVAINLNLQLAELLKRHRIRVEIEAGFISIELPHPVKFKAGAVYEQIKEGINSRLDVTALTDKGEHIFESFGDYGATVEEAVNNNFRNFSAGCLHPLLAASGCTDPQLLHQVTIETWEINGRFWTAYIGNLVPKMLAEAQSAITPPWEFFDCFEKGIKAQQLTKRLHWFRGYYSQSGNEINTREFLMDNDPVAGTNQVSDALPVLPGITFYSCRNFIVLKNQDAGLQQQTTLFHGG